MCVWEGNDSPGITVRTSGGWELSRSWHTQLQNIPYLATPGALGALYRHKTQKNKVSMGVGARKELTYLAELTKSLDISAFICFLHPLGTSDTM